MFQEETDKRTDICTEEPVLRRGSTGLELVGNGQTIKGDFTKLIPRLKYNNLQGELIVKAAKIKGTDRTLTVLDATAGMGEDSFLLAAAGFNVQMYEYDPIIAALLRDALERASENAELKDIAARMQLHEENSITAMRNLTYTPDVIVLDPMFPDRQKSALVKKKFQLLHRLEKPCEDEEALFYAAKEAQPRKIIIKRPLKGALLAGVKPDYSLMGKAIRYDCIMVTKTPII